MLTRDRFWSFVGEPGCWEWRGTKSHGYGYFWYGDVNRRAHRLIWELLYGPIPDGMQVCHRCDNRACVRPDHLFLGTQSDNIQDSITKGRFSRNAGRPSERHRGEWNGNAKLTWDQAMEIRQRVDNGESGRALAKEFGVAPTQISRIKNRQGWTHLEPIGVESVKISPKT